MCPKLVLFFKAIVVYAVLYSGGFGGGGDAEGSRSDGVRQPRGFFYPLFKCLPLFALMFFVALHALRSTSSGPVDGVAVEDVSAPTSRTRAFALKIFLGVFRCTVCFAARPGIFVLMRNANSSPVFISLK